MINRQCQRYGMDLLTISRLLGHTSVSLTERYICQGEGDLAKEHDQTSPVDRLKF